MAVTMEVKLSPLITRKRNQGQVCSKSKAKKDSNSSDRFFGQIGTLNTFNLLNETL